MTRYADTFKTTEGYNVKKVSADFFIFLFSFNLVYLFRRRGFGKSAEYLTLLLILSICWLVSSLITDKLKYHKKGQGYSQRLEPIFYSILLFTGLVSLTIYGLNWIEISHFIIFGFLGLYLFLEVLLLSGNYLPFFAAEPDSRRQHFSYFLFFFDLLVIGAGFFLVHYLKVGTLELSTTYIPLFLVLAFLWIFSGLIVHQFKIRGESSYIRLVYPFFKSSFIVISLTSVIVFVFRTGFSRLLVFGSIGIFISLEILAVTLYFLYLRMTGSDLTKLSPFNIPDISSNRIVERAVEKEREVDEKITFSKTKFVSSFFKRKLEEIYLKDSPRLLAMIDKAISLSTVDILKAEFFNTADISLVNRYEDDSLECLLNLNPLNRFHKINGYLRQANRKLQKGGVMLGVFEPHERRRIYFVKKYPVLLANLLYLFDFIWKRAFPKLPFLRSVYFAITRGKNRLISLAEGLGRVYFTGFEIISLEDIDNYVYFLVRKVSLPLSEKNPSYGLLFKQRRVGKEGKLIYTYKMRTMYPYSEFIHQYIYRRNYLNDKGKIENDFRVTAWGKFLRKFWIDELPMLFNILKRDMGVLGVRPLSETFFNTYPEDLKQLRVQFRPGLIPPYYADMPRSQAEIWASERRYLESYARKPFRTKWRYFFGAVKNILFHGAKSG